MPTEINDDDWRLTGQEQYLTGATLFWRTWHQARAGWDHDHCDFCWAKFMDCDDVPGVLRGGYTTDDERTWVCVGCALDFAARLKLKLIGGPTAQ